ncbi:MAG TPA: hypothetical protein VGC34_14980 [Steroidobacteraceae bacterium]
MSPSNLNMEDVKVRVRNAASLAALAATGARSGSIDTDQIAEALWGFHEILTGIEGDIERALECARQETRRSAGTPS